MMSEAGANDPNIESAGALSTGPDAMPARPLPVHSQGLARTGS